MTLSPSEIVADYLRWKAEWGASSKDFSPENYELQRARETALEKLIKIADALEDQTWDDPLLDEIAKIVED